MLAIELVSPSRFPGWVVRRPFAIVFLVEGVRGGRPREVVDRLEVHFPGEIAAGWLSRDAVIDPSWWSAHWVTELGPMVRSGEPPVGVYLFYLGSIIAHHAATSAAGNEAIWADVREYLIERIRLRRDASREEARSSWSEPPPPPPPKEPQRPAARAPEGPYVLLELDPSASDADAKKAYRDAVRLNHPDKVAHLSKAIQAFAHERMLLINAAWEAIKKERGLP